METIRIDGKEIAKICRGESRHRTQKLISEGVIPHLAVILVGENPASQVYVRNK